MAGAVTVRTLQQADLPPYKRLRDTVLASEPEAFTSDAAQEGRKTAGSYASRLGLDRPDGGHFTLGAFDATGALVGAVSCERETRVKGRHIAHLSAMMVCAAARGQGIGRQLLGGCVAQARRAQGLELLTLSVTATNHVAVELYRRAGFTRYGTLVHAIKLGDRYLDKDLMVLSL